MDAANAEGDGPRVDNEEVRHRAIEVLLSTSDRLKTISIQFLHTALPAVISYSHLYASTAALWLFDWLQTISIQFLHTALPAVISYSQLYASTAAFWFFHWLRTSGWACYDHIYEVLATLGDHASPVPTISFAPFPRCGHCLREFHPRFMTFCLANHAACTECFHGIVDEVTARRVVQVMCTHVSGCGQPSGEVELQGRLLAHPVEAPVPREGGVDDGPVDNGDAQEAEGEGDPFYDAEEGREEGELDVAQAIRAEVATPVIKAEEERRTPASEDRTSVSYPKADFKGKGIAIGSPSPSSYDDDFDTDTDTEPGLQNYSVSGTRAFTNTRRGLLGFHGEGPSRLAEAPASAPPTPVKAPQHAAGETPMPMSTAATAPPMHAPVNQTLQHTTSFRFKAPDDSLGERYAELYDELVKARGVRDKLKSKRGKAELKVRAGIPGWTQHRLDGITTQLNAALQAVRVAEFALDDHRQGL